MAFSIAFRVVCVERLDQDFASLRGTLMEAIERISVIEP